MKELKNENFILFKQELIYNLIIQEAYELAFDLTLPMKFLSGVLLVK